MQKPEAMKFKIEDYELVTRVYVEGGEEKVNAAIEEISQFGCVDKNMLDRGYVSVNIRPTFDKTEVIAYLNEKLQEIL